MISFDTEDSPDLLHIATNDKVVPTEVAKERAQKYDAVLGTNSPGTDSLTANIQNGLEDRYRELLSRQKDVEFQDTKRKMIDDYIKSANGPVSDADIQLLQGIHQADLKDLSDSTNIFESEYAKKYLSTAINADDNKIYFKAEQKDPERVNRLLDMAEDRVIKNNIIHSLQDDYESRRDNESMVGKAWDFAETMVPIWGSGRIKGAVEGSDANSFMVGSNLKEQVDYLNTLPTKEYRDKLTQTYEYLYDKNPLLASQFLEAAKGYSTGSQYLDNFFTAADVAGVAEAGIKGVSSLAKLTGFLKKTVASSAIKSPDAVRSAEIIGNEKVAAAGALTKATAADMSGEAVKETTGTVSRKLPSLIKGDIEKWFEDSPNLTRNVQEELVSDATKRADFVEQMRGAIDKVERLTPDHIFAAATKLYDEQISGRFKSIQQSILDVGQGAKFTTEHDTSTNTYQMVMTIGKKDGTMFNNPQTAQTWATKYMPKGDYQVVPYSDKFVIQQKIDLPETMDYFHDVQPQVQLAKTGFINSLIGTVRSPRHVLNDDNNVARLFATYGTTKLRDMFSELAQPIKDLNGDELKELTATWAHNRDSVDPVTKARGFWFDSVKDLEDHFVERFNHLPSKNQINAYQAYQQLNDLDGAIRNAGWLRDQVRAGISKVTVPYRYFEKTPGFNNGSAKAGGVSVKNASLEFSGKTIDAIDEKALVTHPANVLFYDSADGGAIVMNSKFRMGDIRAKLAEAKGKGYQIIQAADGNLKVPGYDDTKSIAYVVVKNYEKRRLTMEDMPFKPGGHVVNKYPFYAKQGSLSVSSDGTKYLGKDVSVFSAPTEQELGKKVKAFNDAVAMSKSGAPDDQIEAHLAQTLAMDKSDFDRLFKARKNAKGETVPGLSKDLPIIGTRAGQSTADVYKYADDIIQSERSPHNLYSEMDRKFAGERDSSNLDLLGTEDDIAYHDAAGELMDPIQTVNSAIKNVISLEAKRDYLLKSSLDWVTQFKNILAPTSYDLSRSPSRALMQPEYLSGADKTLVRNAEVARKQVLNFIGALNKDETAFETVKRKLENIAYETGGKKRLELVDNWLIPIASNPLRVARTVAFHTKLGLFNPVQLMVQGQTAAHALAFSPKAGAIAASIYPHVRLALLNNNMLDQTAKWAGSMGVKEAWFKEMMGSMKNSGWMEVKGDYGLLDDIANPKVFQSTAGKILDAGTVFFDEGEKVTRGVAYSTAYLEWRSANPTAELTKAVRGKILARADDINLNMSAAQNASWQRGWLSVPSQFFAVQARLMEQYLGDNLSKAEKLRLFGVHSALYGVPVAASGMVGIWPIYESLKSYMVDKNIPYDEGVLGAVIKGIPSAISSALGMDLDIGGRYGPNGANYLRDWMNGKTSLGELAVGPAGSVASDIAQTTIPSMAALASLVTGQPSTYRFGAEDVVNAFKNVSSVNNALKLWYALNTHKWLNKNGQAVDDVSTGEAIAMSITGASLDRINKTYLQMDVLKRRKEYANDVMDRAQGTLRKGLSENDPATREELFKDAWGQAMAGGLTQYEWQDVIRRTLTDLNSQVDTIEKRFEQDTINRRMQ